MMRIEGHQEELLALLRSEPEQSERLLKVGVGTPLAIIAGHVVANQLLPEFGVAPITWLLIIGYGIVMAVLSGRLVHTALHWQIEAARSAQKLGPKNAAPVLRQVSLKDAAEDGVETGLAPQSASTVPPQTTATATGFHLTYFLLRLRQDVLRARREGLDLCVVAFEVTSPHEGEQPEVLDRIANEMATIAAKQVKTIELPAQVGASEYVFALPEVGGEAARQLASNLVRALGEYWCHFGVAVYPDDAHDAETLLDFARHEVEESRQDVRSSRRRPAAKRA